MSLIDLTVEVKREKWEKIFANEKMTAFGHLGTHFDGMNITFDLANCKRPGVVLDVSTVTGRDIKIDDIDTDRIAAGLFVLFYTGFSDTEEYGTEHYFTKHPQLSHRLIQCLLDKQVAMIGIDAAGIRRGEEHTPTDQVCADRGVFVVENIADLSSLISAAGNKPFTVYTFPVKFEGMSGLPCRIVAEV